MSPLLDLKFVRSLCDFRKPVIVAEPDVIHVVYYCTCLFADFICYLMSSRLGAVVSMLILNLLSAVCYGLLIQEKKLKPKLYITKFFCDWCPNTNGFISFLRRSEAR